MSCAYTCPLEQAIAPSDYQKLIQNHSYGVMQLFEQSVDLQFVLLKNTWAHTYAWSGELPRGASRYLPAVRDSDTEFWIPFKVFCRMFNRLYVCHVNAMPVQESIMVLTLVFIAQYFCMFMVHVSRASGLMTQRVDAVTLPHSERIRIMYWRLHMWIQALSLPLWPSQT